MNKEDKKASSQEDIELVEKAKKGNEDARETLLRKYKYLVCSIIRPYYLRGGDDEDLIQEGLIAVNTAINNYSEETNASFSTFAYSCIRNKIIDVIRQTRNLDETDELSDEKSGEASFEDDIIYNQLIEDLKNIVEQNGTKSERRILEMYLEGSTYSEIAQSIGKDYKFVDNKLQKIKRLVVKSTKEWN